jgi:uncharacterized membrane protein YkvA (DUF1232 family)
MNLEKKRPLLLSVMAWAAAAIYAVSPVDLIPDVLPLIGWADDAVTLCLAAMVTLYAARRRARAQEIGSATTT